MADKAKQNTKAPDQPLYIDEVIIQLLDAKTWKPQANARCTLPQSDIEKLCKKAQEIFISQPMLLELEAPIKICGDTHGQYYDLIQLFRRCGFPPDSNYLFLGDYVDRGRQSIETICLLLAYKIKYPENFFLLRGNHECPIVNCEYGFFEECKKRYSVRLWRVFNDCFQFLPVAAIVDERIFCCHGGLSPHLKSMSQISKLERARKIPDEGLLCDLLWSDPSAYAGYGENDRGVSCTFGGDVVTKFNREHDFQLVCRGHLVVEDGYEFFAKRQLVTVFSAPNYCGEFDNAGAVMNVQIVNDELMCSFTVLKPHNHIGKIAVKAPQATPTTNGVGSPLTEEDEDEETQC